MKDEVSNIPVNMKTREVLLGDDCLKALDLCKAFCCSYFQCINLTEEEYRSGKYRARAVCLYDAGNPCRHPDISCPNREYSLERKPDGSCVYLDERNMCSIHETKPKACRDFVCKGSWKIHFDSGAAGGAKAHLQKLRGDMVFLPNPYVKLVSLIYSTKRKEVIFSKRIVSRCGVVTTKRVFDVPGVDDEKLGHFLGLFDGKRTLDEIDEAFKQKYGQEMTKKEFDNTVWLFKDEGFLLFRSPAWEGCPAER